MSINIAALNALLPPKASASIPSRSSVFPPLQGPCDLTQLKALPSNLGVSNRYLTVIESVRGDVRWAALYHGDLSDYGGDHSRGDLALCGEFARRGLNEWQIDVATRTSGLYRGKWERDDYRNSTIGRALAGVKASGSAMSPASLLDPLNGAITINIGQPAPRDYVVDSLLCAGKTAILAGFGGVSKTQLALQLSIDVALGGSFVNHAVKLGNVMAICGEEDRAEIERRLSAIVKHRRLNAAEIQVIEANVLAYPLVGQDIRLTSLSKTGLAETQFAQAIIDQAKATGNIRLIVLDHLSVLHGGDFNAREDAAQTMRVINHIAEGTGAAVLALAHTPKSANDKEESDASMVAGSTAFVDQARAAWVMATMRKEEAKRLSVPDADRKNYVSLAVTKNNYGPTGDVYWFKRVPIDGTAFLEHVALSVAGAASKAATSLEASVIAFVAANPGQYSKTKLRDSQSGKKGRFKASKSTLEDVIETLISIRRLVNRPPTPAERTTYGHSTHVTHVLNVPQPPGGTHAAQP